MYQRRLGLDFQHTEADGEQLRVVVTQVDPRNHARPFQFAVQVVGDNTYAGKWWQHSSCMGEGLLGGGIAAGM